MISKISTFLSAKANSFKVILMALFYCVISYQFFINIDGFNPFYYKTFPITHRYIGVGIIFINLLLSIIFVFIQKFDWKTKLISIFQINLISTIAFIYYAINSKQYIFSIFDLQIDSGLLIIPLIGLVFFSVKNALEQNFNNYFLLLLKILLIYLTIFSVDSIFTSDSSIFRNINNFWLSNLFSIQKEIWTILGVASISLFTTSLLKLNSTKKFLTQFIVFLFINLQVIYLIKVINLSSFNFWHKSLFMLIFWDICFYFFKVLNKSTTSSDLSLRINLSILYHFVLYFILIFVSYI
jgi:hypothetical protein